MEALTIIIIINMLHPMQPKHGIKYVDDTRIINDHKCITLSLAVNCKSHDYQFMINVTRFMEGHMT